MKTGEVRVRVVPPNMRKRSVSTRRSKTTDKIRDRDRAKDEDDDRSPARKIKDALDALDIGTQRNARRSRFMYLPDLTRFTRGVVTRASATAAKEATSRVIATSTV